MLTMCLNAVSHACHCQHIAIVTASAVAKHVHAVVGMLYIIEQITHKLVKYGKYKRYVMYTRRPVQNWMKINSIGSKCVAKQLATTGHERVAQYGVGLTTIVAQEVESSPTIHLVRQVCQKTESTEICLLRSPAGCSHTH